MWVWVCVRVRDSVFNRQLVVATHERIIDTKPAAGRKCEQERALRPYRGVGAGWVRRLVARGRAIGVAGAARVVVGDIDPVRLNVAAGGVLDAVEGIRFEECVALKDHKRKLCERPLPKHNE